MTSTSSQKLHVKNAENSTLGDCGKLSKCADLPHVAKVHYRLSINLAVRRTSRGPQGLPPTSIITEKKSFSKARILRQAASQRSWNPLKIIIETLNSTGLLNV
ncbi:hypothetical protein [Flexibacterium corallicola]|uniref:hypothetical protein n=1 Tax=Flexibacterium corallicola TaxID=3037259 RepID=UPI00286EF588|nr:hypothetical protein [Pseudovibrio sp. M1P-2-3]